MTASIRHTFAATCITLGLLASAPLTQAAESGTTVVSAAAQMSELSTFYRLVQQAGLSSALEAPNVTVFAPTDEAFKAVPAATMDKLSKDPELLKSVLSFHVLPGNLKASAIDGSAQPTSLQGGKLNISKAGDFVTVEDALVIKADIQAGNSVIHEIDRVLMPAVKK
ncbi:MAG TPA: fasciclin domain-containing protein [Aquabacterium sp.]|uniref:fasciclin domain-containing protein n=1 Tax=Aquabacterium sp. TaxID=1872578 RepID=UPI002E3653E1|nr:fasciclin domain-containing protein [Aquabacterium sp.]HEX5372838.1 fasciclin domain-containing protein [Aquabacterium sp.]